MLGGRWSLDKWSWRTKRQTSSWNMSRTEMTQTYGVDLTENRAGSHYCELSNTGFVKKATHAQILWLFRPSCLVTYLQPNRRRTHITTAPLSHWVTKLSHSTQLHWSVLQAHIMSPLQTRAGLHISFQRYEIGLEFMWVWSIFIKTQMFVKRLYESLLFNSKIFQYVCSHVTFMCVCLPCKWLQHILTIHLNTGAWVNWQRWGLFPASFDDSCTVTGHAGRWNYG